MFLGIDRLRELAGAIRTTTTTGGVVSPGVIPAFSRIVMTEAAGAFAKRAR